MASTANNTGRSSYELAVDGLRIQVQALSTAQAKLYQMLIGGATNEGEINSRIADLETKIRLKDKEISALRLRASVSAGPTPEQIEALKSSVTALEQMNATASALHSIMSATLNIADAALYSPKATADDGRAATAAGERSTGGVGVLLMAAAGGAAAALAAVAVARAVARS
jgi:hypothetical protein